MKKTYQQKKNAYQASKTKSRIQSYQIAKEQIINGNWNLAKTILLDLYQQYPTDDGIARDYANVLTNLRLYQEAIDVLEECNEFQGVNYKNLLQLYIREKNYEAAIDLYQSLTDANQEELKQLGLENFQRLAAIYLHKFDKSVDLPENIRGYMELSYLGYDPSFALRYIKLRHCIDSPLPTKQQGSLFESSKEASILFHYLKDSVDEKNLEGKSNHLSDVYLYKYNTNSFNHLKVETIPNTKQIITMYPVSYSHSKIKDCDSIDKVKVLW